ncbi:MAG TPA: hypothetical protein VF060_29930 [Trebonia sp.]
MNDIDLDRVWTGVAAEVWRRHPGRLERAAARLLRSPGLARALLTTPSLLLPWLIATVVIFGTGAVIQAGSGEPFVWVLAPAVAAVGIAYAYGPGLDPAWELVASSAVSDRMIMLARAVAVFAVNAAFGLVAGVLSASAARLTFAWLIPMAAVCALTLAVAVAVRNAMAGAAVGVAAWGAIVLVKSTGGGGAYGGAVTDSALYLPYLAVAVCCAAVVFYATRPQKGTL